MENESNKMTAVEWLIEDLGEYFPHGVGGIELMVKKAKQMEKKQIKDAYLTCHKEYTAYGKHWEMGMDEKETFEQYYEQKYGGNK
jgi:hypothetical protein